MIKYSDVLNDKYIKDIFEKTEAFETLESVSAWCDHGTKHSLKVVAIIEKIMLHLNCSKEDVELGKITGLLHDIGAVEGKKDHATRSYNMSKVYLENKDISEVNKNTILSAIIDHSNGENIQSIIGASLLIADKIDLDKTRILKEGTKVEGVKELCNIDKIDIDFEANNMKINFITNDAFSKTELMKFYFITKSIKTIFKASDYLNIKPQFSINGIFTNFLEQS